jgi:hypothetical protein
MQASSPTLWSKHFPTSSFCIRRSLAPDNIIVINDLKAHHPVEHLLSVRDKTPFSWYHYLSICCSCTTF